MSTRRVFFSISSFLFLLAVGGVAGWAAGTGLTGEYYDNKDLTNLKLTRVDPMVNFSWGLSSPDPSVANDTFSVRWSGQVEALFSQAYKFYATTDDGVRLWVNGQLIIDKWIDQKAENSGSIALVAGQKYDLKMEYYENGSGAVAQLSWSSPSQPKQIIPQGQLYPTSGGTPPPPPPPPSGSGVTYYVAKTGKDTNACTSTAPCLTIQKGVSKAIAPGDTVIVMAGTYVEFVGTWNSGAKDKPIIVQANPGDTVIWRAPSQVLSTVDGALTITDRRFIRIQGFRFEGSVTRTTLRVRNSSTSKTNPVQGIEVVGNTFKNNGNNGVGSDTCARPVAFQNTGHNTFGTGAVVNTISGNTFDGNYGWNIQLLRSNDTVVSNNVCTNVKSSFTVNTFVARFLQFGSGATRNVIEGNTVSNIAVDSYVGSSKYSATAIKFDASASGNTARRNIIHDIALNAAGAIGGIETESGCNNNQIYENIVYRVKIGLRNGSFSTNVSQGNVWKNNVASDCQCGMMLSRSKGLVIKNNIFFNNSLSQVWVSAEAVSSGGHVFSNNDYFKAGAANIGVWNSGAKACTTADKNLTQWSSSSGDKNSLSVAPKFVNPPSDFHLQSSSPVKDKGEGGVDMGAYPGNAGAGLTISQQGPVLLTAQAAAQTNPFNSNETLVRRTASPESQPFNRSRLEVMVDVLASRNTQAFLLIRNDRIVTEWYAPGRDPAKTQPVASMAKGLVGGMSLLVAVNDGHLSLNDWAWKYIPAWRQHPQKSQIRIAHLATHTSGLEDAEGPEEWKASFWKRVPDPFSIALLEAPLLFFPGTDIAYSNPGMAALAYAVTASLKGAQQSDIRSLLQERIMQPVGIPETEWSIGYSQPSQLDGLKLYANWGGAAYSPRAIAKVGRLMLRQGNWQGRQLVASSWVTEMISPHDSRFGSALCLWTNASGRWPSLPRDAFAAAGSGHQVLLVVPSLDLIVVRVGNKLTDQTDFWAGIEEFLFDPLMDALLTVPKR